jgi:hypothetical protein
MKRTKPVVVLAALLAASLVFAAEITSNVAFPDGNPSQLFCWQ